MNGFTSALTAVLSYDNRDDRFLPSKGIFASLSIDYAGLGGDLEYTKINSSFRYFKKIFWDIVWRNNLIYGVVFPNDKQKPVPFNRLFLLGGANSLRGFDWFSVGRRRYSWVEFERIIEKKKEELERQGRPPDLSYNEEQNARKLAFQPFGGKQQVMYNLEFQFPLLKQGGMMGILFADVGQAEDTLSLSRFRSDVGFGIRWFSPIGPWRFEWGFPIKRRKDLGESPMHFQLMIGTPF